MARSRLVPEQGDLFRVGKFCVSLSGLRINGRATVEQWENALSVVAKSKDAVQWAIGDMMVYADDRKFPDDVVERALDATGYKRGTLMNMKSLSKTFPVTTATRSLLSWSHHALVAGFEVAERDELLRRAANERMTWEMLQAETRGRRHARRVAELLWPDATYGVIMAKPPWRPEAGTAAPDTGFETMATDQICALTPRVQAITAPNALLFLWAPSLKVATGEASDVVKAWGFTGRSTHVWVKELQGSGHWTRDRHEHCLIAARGVPVAPSVDLVPDSVLSSNAGVVNDLPREIYDVIARCYPTYPKVQLFVEHDYGGWDSWGRELIERAASRATRVRDEQEEIPA